MLVLCMRPCVFIEKCRPVDNVLRRISNKLYIPNEASFGVIFFSFLKGNFYRSATTVE